MRATCVARPDPTMSKKSRLKMGRYRPPKRESINELLAVARRRVTLPDAGWEGIGESFVRSLIKERLLPPLVPGTKAAGRGRAVRMTQRGYRDLLSILRLRALGVRRREWAFYLWIRGSPFPETTVRVAAIASFKRIAKTSSTTSLRPDGTACLRRSRLSARWTGILTRIQQWHPFSRRRSPT
jgi:hypothetical protein